MCRFQLAMILRWQDMWHNMQLYFSIEYCTVISNARASEITTMQRSTYFSKLFCFWKSPSIGLMWGSCRQVLSEYAIKSLCVDKSALRIKKSLIYSFNYKVSITWKKIQVHWNYTYILSEYQQVIGNNH